MMEQQRKYASFIASDLKYGVLRVSSDQFRSNLVRNWSRTSHTDIAFHGFNKPRGFLNLYEELDTEVRPLIPFYKYIQAVSDSMSEMSKMENGYKYSIAYTLEFDCII